MGRMNISIIGLGKLGSPMAACFAAKGHNVVGVDLNEAFVQSINQGIAPVFEPGLQEMLDQSDGRLTATSDLRKAVAATEITFVIVPTPSLTNGGFSTKHVLACFEQLAKVLAVKESYHVVVVTSTVMPGATGGELKEALEQASGKSCPQDFGLCYSPEFISLGSVIKNYLHPDLVLIGESDPVAGDRLSEVYRTVCENNPPIKRMSFANAELTKLAVNTFVTTKISYANMLAEICERLDQGDVDVVTAAVGEDSRVGKKFLTGALGYGGPCFPRDNRAIIHLAKQLDVLAPLPVATDEINSHQVTRLRELVRKNRPLGGKVGILGLAYKPDTNVVEQSQGLMLAQELSATGIPVQVYDPHAHENAKMHLPKHVEYASSASALARSVDVLVITLPCQEYKAISSEDVARQNTPATVIDCWRILSREEFGPLCNYIRIGEGGVDSTSNVLSFSDYTKRKEAA